MTLTERLEFQIKGLPKLANQLLRSTWQTRSGHARQWKRKVWASCWHLKPDTPLNQARLTLTRVSSQEPDHDGLVSSFKHCIDGLVEAKILVDDKPANIKSTYLWEKGPRNCGHIKIKVDEIITKRE